MPFLKTDCRVFALQTRFLIVESVAQAMSNTPQLAELTPPRSPVAKPAPPLCGLPLLLRHHFY